MFTEHFHERFQKKYKPFDGVEYLRVSSSLRAPQNDVGTLHKMLHYASFGIPKNLYLNEYLC